MGEIYIYNNNILNVSLFLFFSFLSKRNTCTCYYIMEERKILKRCEKNGTKARSRNVIRSVENHFPPRVPFLSLHGKNREPRRFQERV